MADVNPPPAGTVTASRTPTGDAPSGGTSAGAAPDGLTVLTDYLADGAWSGDDGRITLDAAGRIEESTVGVTGIGGVPFRARSIEQRLSGLRPTPSVLEESCGDVPEADPTNDLHADADYRRQLLRVHATRALTRALERARSAIP